MKRRKKSKQNRYLMVLLFLSLGFIFSIFVVSSINFYSYLNHHSLEKKLGINNLILTEGINEKEIINFLRTVNPKYTEGINKIIVISDPLFSFSVVNSDGEELYHGEASGQFLQKERSIIFTYNKEFRDNFYHEIGHYIHLVLFTGREREEWENLVNLSIDYNKFEHFRTINNLNDQEFPKLDEYVETSYDHQIEEAFATYFALSMLNESGIPYQEVKDYFKNLSWNDPVNCNSYSNTTIREAQDVG